MTTLAKTLAITAYSINVIIFILFLWNGVFTLPSFIIMFTLIFAIPFLFRAFGLLLKKMFKVKL